jgi:PAS domain S-box-containing protein
VRSSKTNSRNRPQARGGRAGPQARPPDLGRSTRGLRIALACNEALARESSQAELLRNVCRLLVDVGGFRLALAAGYAEGEGRVIRPVAHHARGGEDLAVVQRAWAASAEEGLAATALRTSRRVVANDLLSDAHVVPSARDELARAGHAAAVALPILAEDEQPRALVVVSGRRDDFDAVTVEVLQSVSGDVAQRISAIRTRTFLSGMIEHAPVPFYVVRSDGRFALVNGAFEEATGRSRDEVIGHRVADVFPAHAGRYLEANARVLATGRALRVEEQGVVRAQQRLFESTKFPVPDATGRLTAVAGFSVDVTDRRLAEDRLRFQARLLEEISDAVVAVDPEERVTYANRAALERYAPGARIEDVLGRVASELCEPRWTDPGGREAACRAVATAGAWSGEVLHLRGDGVATAVEATVIALRDEAGRAAGSFAVVRDISERKAAETALRDSREALRALALRLQTIREEEKTRIARDLHDELGQLVTLLKLDVSAVERRLGALDPRSVGPVLDRAVAATELLDQMAASVQRIASELRPGVLDKVGLDAALQQEGERFAQRCGVAFRATVSGDARGLPPDVATALYRIAQEALTNVARHAHASLVELELAVRPEEAALVVEDDGRGMPADAGARRGLGLLGVNERALALGGEVRVERRQGGGTRVIATVPLGRRGAGGPA